MSTITDTKTDTNTDTDTILNTDADPTLNINKVDVGMKRGLIQIEKTISFEFLRHAKKLIAMLLTGLFIFVLFYIIQIVTENNSGEAIATSTEFVQEFLTMIDFFIMIVAVTFFGSIIAEDFEKDTGNLLLPKIPKYRLFIGRYIARYIYGCLSVAFYYLVVGITALIIYGDVPGELWGSMLWAMWYLFGVTAFITFFSSIMKRSASAMIIGIMFILIVFNLANMIFMFTGIEAEPFYFLTYYASIITQWFAMPDLDARFAEIPIRGGPGSGGVEGATYFSWLTPSPAGAIIGILVYSAICLTVAYFFYQRRQN